MRATPTHHTLKAKTMFGRMKPKEREEPGRPCVGTENSKQTHTRPFFSAAIMPMPSLRFLHRRALSNVAPVLPSCVPEVKFHPPCPYVQINSSQRFLYFIYHDPELTAASLPVCVSAAGVMLVAPSREESMLVEGRRSPSCTIPQSYTKQRSARRLGHSETLPASRAPHRIRRQVCKKRNTRTHTHNALSFVFDPAPRINNPSVIKSPKGRRPACSGCWQRTRA